MGVTVSGLTNFWGGMALIGVAFATALLRLWPNLWRRIRGKPSADVRPVVDTLEAERRLMESPGGTGLTLINSMRNYFYGLKSSGYKRAVALDHSDENVFVNPELHQETAAPPSVAPPVGRNDPCPCGSGKRFKKCHGAKRSGSK